MGHNVLGLGHNIKDLEPGSLEEFWEGEDCVLRGQDLFDGRTFQTTKRDPLLCHGDQCVEALLDGF